uniref:PRO0890 n=1 Tax=Homo sapiens TaxID=9606 RepID=Q9P1M0_HUMAN|nr:PRO0890 [Homo sapiens]
MEQGRGVQKENTSNKEKQLKESGRARWLTPVILALCPRPGATHLRGDRPGNGRPDQGSCSLTGGHCPGRSSRAPGRRAPGG